MLLCIALPKGNTVATLPQRFTFRQSRSAAMPLVCPKGNVSRCFRMGARGGTDVEYFADVGPDVALPHGPVAESNLFRQYTGRVRGRPNSPSSLVAAIHGHAVVAMQTSKGRRLYALSFWTNFLAAWSALFGSFFLRTVLHMAMGTFMQTEMSLRVDL